MILPNKNKNKTLKHFIKITIDSYLSLHLPMFSVLTQFYLEHKAYLIGKAHFPAFLVTSFYQTCGAVWHMRLVWHHSWSTMIENNTNQTLSVTISRMSVKYPTRSLILSHKPRKIWQTPEYRESPVSCIWSI